MTIPRPCIHVECQSEYSRLLDCALQLVGPVWRTSFVRSWKLLKRLQVTVREHSVFVCAKNWRTKACNTTKGTINWFCSMTMSDPKVQKWSSHTWERWTGRVYSTCKILHTLLSCTIISFELLHMTWQMSTSSFMQKSRVGEIRGLLQMTTSFLGQGLLNCLKHRES